ncbi:MAG: hypothetical protein CEE43_15040 [Promethearchaeota archaeon Loki_b32]|nr:MAG: hypothetical protein CEE43_15040 [Candidatus Lokiarchaeota archaeon Loki_b32]
MEEKSSQIDDIKKFRRKYYDAHARIYDGEWNEDSIEEFLSFKKKVSITPGAVVLDIATGTGIYLIHMAKSGALCYGIDQSPKMLKHLNLRIKKENVEQSIKKISVGVADDLHYPDQYFRAKNKWKRMISLLK